MTPISERQRAHFYAYNKQKMKNLYIYTQKAGHFTKSKTICVTFILRKSHTLYVTRFFMKFLKLAFKYIYQKHDTLRYVTLLYTERRTLRKKQDNLRYVFTYKDPDTLGYIFMGKKKALWDTFLYLKFIV